MDYISALQLSASRSSISNSIAESTINLSNQNTTNFEDFTKTSSKLSCTVKLINSNGYPLKGKVVRVVEKVTLNLETVEELQPVSINSVFTCNEFLSSNLRYIWSKFPALELDFLPIEVTVFNKENGRVYDQERKWLPVRLSPDELEKNIFNDKMKSSFRSYLKKKTSISSEIGAELEFADNSTVIEYINAPDSSWSVQSRAKLIWMKTRTKGSRKTQANTEKITKKSWKCNILSLFEIYVIFCLFHVLFYAQPKLTQRVVKIHVTWEMRDTLFLFVLKDNYRCLLFLKNFFF